MSTSRTPRISPDMHAALRGYAQVERSIGRGTDVPQGRPVTEGAIERRGLVETYREPRLGGATCVRLTVAGWAALVEADRAEATAATEPTGTGTPFITALCYAGRHDQCRGHIGEAVCECPAAHPARPVEPAPEPAPVHGAVPAIYSPAGLTRDGWSTGASPYLGGCDTIAMGSLAAGARRSFTVAVQHGRIHVWSDHAWQGHTRSVPVVVDWLTANGAGRADRIAASLAEAMRAAGTVGRYITWTADGTARFGWVRPAERYAAGTVVAMATGSGVQQIVGGPWTYLAEPGALVEVEPGAGCRPGCDQPAATVVADPGVGAAAVCTAHTGWATPAAYLPSVLPTVADILGAPVEPVEVDAVELRDRRSIAQRIGIGDQLAHEIDTAVNYPGSAPAGGYTILPDGEAARELYPVESAALAWVHDMVWRQCRPVTIGALRDQLARLRAELAQPAEAAPGRSVPLAATTRGPSVVVSPDFAAYAAGELPADRLRCALCGHAPCGCPPFGTPAYLALVDQVHGHARASAHDDGRPAIYLPSGLTRDGWPEGAGPDPIGCRPIAAGPADPTGHPSDRLRGRYFLGSRLGRLHVWLDDIWRGHTRDLDVVTVWLMRHGATRVDLIREQCAGLIAEWEATSMLGQHVTWAVGDGYRYGWVEPRHLDDDTPTGIVSVLHVTGTVYRVPVRELDRTGEATAPEWAAGQPCRWLPGCERPSVAQYQHPRRGPVDICGPCRVMATGATG